LDRMLQKESCHDHRQCQKPFVNGDTKNRSGEAQRRGIGLDHALDIPFLIELLRTRINVFQVHGIIADGVFELVVDASIDRRIGVASNPLPGGW
jgi:hypothetical protein